MLNANMNNMYDNNMLRFSQVGSYNNNPNYNPASPKSYSLRGNAVSRKEGMKYGGLEDTNSSVSRGTPTSNGG